MQNQIHNGNTALQNDATQGGGSKSSAAVAQARARSRNRPADDFANAEGRFCISFYGDELEQFQKRAREGGTTVSELMRRIVRSHLLDRPCLSDEEILVLRNCYRALSALVVVLDDTWDGIEKLIVGGELDERFRSIAENDKRLAGEVRELRDRIGRILELAESRDVLKSCLALKVRRARNGAKAGA